eukprot:2539791-Pleurochrysis_carterae.AAC.1
MQDGNLECQIEACATPVRTRKAEMLQPLELRKRRRDRLGALCPDAVPCAQTPPRTSHAR